MRKKQIKKSIVIKVSALMLVLCMLCSCSSAPGVSISVLNSVQTRNIITAIAENPESVHYSSDKKSFTENVATSGLIKLVIDKSTCSFGVYDTAGGTLWTALPLLEDLDGSENYESKASMISLRIAGGSDVYELNSQDNSLAYGKAKVDTEGGKAVFTYDLFPDAATAEKETLTKDDIGFRATMSVELVDGNMNVSCTFKNLTGNKNAFIENAEILNSFGAYNDLESGDFIFVPDGCGAIINTAIYDESFESLTFGVYGEDYANPKDISGSAIIPVFGIKHGNCAFAAIIEDGDATALINAEKATSSSSYNRAYASFNITPVSYTDNTLYISDRTATVNSDEKSKDIGGIKICYRFLSGKNATYGGLASAVREQLIRDGVLSSLGVSEMDYLPFFLTVSGSVKKSLLSASYQSALTDFDQAKDMLVRMKNKGINNVNIRYTDIFTGGQDSEDIEDASILLKTGGTSKLSELYEYVSSQKMGLYLDIDLISSVKKFKSNVIGIEKNIVTYTPVDEVAESAGTSLKSRYIRNSVNLDGTVVSLLSDTSDMDFSGFCVNDAGSILCSDFSSSGSLRQEASEKISAAVLPLSTSRDIMVDTGNFYLLKNVDSIINIPIDTTVSKSGAYQPVPFVQIVLHGILDYAGSPINTAVNSSEQMLRCIEYGACPHYEWNYEPLVGEGDKYYYDNTINEAAEFYTRANNALGDLRDARITDHYEVEDGIFCTEYDTGSMIYVNYTGSDYEALGVTVYAGDFQRIN